MARTQTRCVNLEVLRTRGPSAATVVQLMMACNDMTLANQALGEWKIDQPNMRKARQTGAALYFIRTQISHLHEALKIVGKVRDDPALRAVVDRCPEPVKHALSKLDEVLPGGPDHSWFKRVVGQVRHNLTFHYHQCDRLILKAIEDRAGRAEGRISAITRSDSSHLWHFKVADDIVDSVVVRQMWGIPREADLREEADKIAGRTDDLVRAFLDFSGNFIWMYCCVE